MVKNLFSDVSFYCMNPVHPEPIQMKLKEHAEGIHDDFFACPKYMEQDEKHPDGHTTDEKACLNRLSLSDAGDILSYFNKIVDADMASWCIADYTNYTFTFRKTITVKVLYFKNSTLRLGILNHRTVKD